MARGHFINTHEPWHLLSFEAVRVMINKADSSLLSDHNTSLHPPKKEEVQHMVLTQTQRNHEVRQFA